MIWGLQSFYHVPGLPLHHGYLPCIHFLLKVGILAKAPSKGELCIAPPLLGG